MFRNQYQHSVRECQLLSVTLLFSKSPFWKSFLALCKAKASIVSVFTGAVVMNDREQECCG